MFNLKNLIGDPNKRKLDKLRPEVALINSLAPELAVLSDRQLQEKTGEFKQRLEKGEPLDELLPEAFAVVREAATRVIERTSRHGQRDGTHHRRRPHRKHSACVAR